MPVGNVGAIQSSGLKEASGAIKATAGYLWGLTVIGDFTNAATAKIYNDPDSADGTLLAQVTVKAGSRNVKFTPPIVANAGLYLSLSGTNADCIVYWE